MLSFFKKRDKEVIICAAVMATDGSIYRGHRHHNAILACREHGKRMSSEPGRQQGFITSRNRYVNRLEAMILQKAAGIKSRDGYRGEQLYSEDLY